MVQSKEGSMVMVIFRLTVDVYYFFLKELRALYNNIGKYSNLIAKILSVVHNLCIYSLLNNSLWLKKK